MSDKDLFLSANRWYDANNLDKTILLANMLNRMDVVDDGEENHFLRSRGTVIPQMVSGLLGRLTSSTLADLLALDVFGGEVYVPKGYMLELVVDVAVNLRESDPYNDQPMAKVDINGKSFSMQSGSVVIGRRGVVCDLNFGSSRFNILSHSKQGAGCSHTRVINTVPLKIRDDERQAIDDVIRWVYGPNNFEHTFTDPTIPTPLKNGESIVGYVYSNRAADVITKWLDGEPAVISPEEQKTKFVLDIR